MNETAPDVKASKPDCNGQKADVPALLMRNPTSAAEQTATTPGAGRLVNGETLLEEIWDTNSRPSTKWLQRMTKKRRIPSIKLGHFRFYSPEQVRETLFAK